MADARTPTDLALLQAASDAANGPDDAPGSLHSKDMRANALTRMAQEKVQAKRLGRPRPSRAAIRRYAIRRDPAAATPQVSSPTFSDLKRLRLMWEVNAALKLYVMTDDARPIWQAYRLLRRAGEAVPEAILGELDRLADAIHGAERKDFLSAMKLHHPRLQEAGARLRLASRIESAKRVFGITTEAARELIAVETGGSLGAIRRAHQRHTNPPTEQRVTKSSRKKSASARPRNSVFDTSG